MSVRKVNLLSASATDQKSERMHLKSSRKCGKWGWLNPLNRRENRPDRRALGELTTLLK